MTTESAINNQENGCKGKSLSLKIEN